MGDNEELVFRTGRLIQTVNSFRIPLHTCAAKYEDVKRLLRQIDKDQRYLLIAGVQSFYSSASQSDLKKLATLLMRLRTLLTDPRVEKAIEEWEQANATPTAISAENRFSTEGIPSQQPIKQFR